MADTPEKSPATTEAQPKATDLNSRWKDLDAIFQTKLKKLVEQKNREMFNQLTAELGFTKTQQDLLFDSIGTFMVELASNVHLSAPFRPPFGLNHHHLMAQSRAPPPAPHGISHSLRSPIPPNERHCSASPPRLYAIPNNRNESVCRAKRKRADHEMDNDDDEDEDDDDDDEDDDDEDFDEATEDEDSDVYDALSSPPKRKKRKVIRVEDVWQKGDDRDLSQKETKELEQEGIYVVEQIVTHRKNGARGNKLEYKVKWQGYTDETWEPALHLNEGMLVQYWENTGMELDATLAAQQLQKLEKKQRKQESQDLEATPKRAAKTKSTVHTNTDTNTNTNNSVSRKHPKSKQKKKRPSSVASGSKSKPKAKSSSAKKARMGQENSDNSNIELPHCCDQCGKSFKSKMGLGGHMAGAHKELFKNGTLKRKRPRNKKKKRKRKPSYDEDNDVSEKSQKTPVPFWEDSDEEQQLIVLDE